MASPDWRIHRTSSTINGSWCWSLRENGDVALAQHTVNQVYFAFYGFIYSASRPLSNCGDSHFKSRPFYHRSVFLTVPGTWSVIGGLYSFLISGLFLTQLINAVSQTLRLDREVPVTR